MMKTAKSHLKTVRDNVDESLRQTEGIRESMRDTVRDTKEQILLHARNLLQSRGFNAFSFQDLADELKIRKASVYHHFHSKEELGLALLERYQSGFHAWSAKVTDLDPQAQLDRYFQLFQKLLNDGEKICPGGILSADLNTLPISMREGLQALQKQHAKWLEEILTKGRDAQVFQSDSPVQNQMYLIASSIQGALQIARVHGSPEIFHSVISQLRQTLMKD